ncbi:hypothetical protein M8J75_015711 [Diaphorina citri]|nr:hypothetical protein M8J75_015711 [Diaphorina citri]
MPMPIGFTLNFRPQALTVASKLRPGVHRTSNEQKGPPTFDKRPRTLSDSKRVLEKRELQFFKITIGEAQAQGSRVPLYQSISHHVYFSSKPSLEDSALGCGFVSRPKQT